MIIYRYLICKSFERNTGFSSFFAQIYEFELPDYSEDWSLMVLLVKSILFSHIFFMLSIPIDLFRELPYDNIQRIKQ